MMLKLRRFQPLKFSTNEIITHLRAVVASPNLDGGPTTIRRSTADLVPGDIPIFSCFLTAGLVPPFSDFFNKVMETFKLHILQLYPQVVLVLSIFAHL